MLEKQKKVVIIGGGIIGCSTAYFLSKAGHSNIVVVEAVGVAHAASGRAGGFLARDWCNNQPTKDLAQRGFILHETLSKDLGLDIGYRRLRTLSLDINESKSNEGKPKAHIPDWIDGNVITAAEIGSLASTAQVHPALVTRALMTRAADEGVELLLRKVTGLAGCRDGAYSLMLDNGETLQGDVIVLAMGPWTGLGLEWFKKSNVVVGKRAHSISFQVESGEVDNTALFLEYSDNYEGKSIEPEVYPRPDGTVYICGNSDDSPLPEDPARVEEDKEACNKLIRVAHSVSDKFSSAAQATTSACFLPTSLDHTPLVGQVPGLAGVYVASGHYCWGILQGPPTGEALAQLILTGQVPEILRNFDPARLIK